MLLDDSGDELDTEEVIVNAASLNRSQIEKMEKRRHKWWIIRRQLLALLVKRFHNFRRSLKGAFCEVICLKSCFFAASH